MVRTRGQVATVAKEADPEILQRELLQAQDRIEELEAEAQRLAKFEEQEGYWQKRYEDLELTGGDVFPGRMHLAEAKLELLLPEMETLRAELELVRAEHAQAIRANDKQWQANMDAQTDLVEARAAERVAQLQAQLDQERQEHAIALEDEVASEAEDYEKIVAGLKQALVVKEEEFKQSVAALEHKHADEARAFGERVHALTEEYDQRLEAFQQEQAKRAVEVLQAARDEIKRDYEQQLAEARRANVPPPDGTVRATFVRACVFMCVRDGEMFNYHLNKPTANQVADTLRERMRGLPEAFVGSALTRAQFVFESAMETNSTVGIAVGYGFSCNVYGMTFAA